MLAITVPEEICILDFSLRGDDWWCIPLIVLSPVGHNCEPTFQHLQLFLTEKHPLLTQYAGEVLHGCLFGLFWVRPWAISAPSLNKTSCSQVLWRWLQAPVFQTLLRRAVRLLCGGLPEVMHPPYVQSPPSLPWLVGHCGAYTCHHNIHCISRAI